VNAASRFGLALTLVAICALAAGGCASNFQGAFPPLKDPQRAAEVVVLRPSRVVGAAVAYGVQIDAKDAFAIGSGQHARFRLDAGEHSLGVRCLSDPLGMRRPAFLRFAAKPDTTHYVLVTPGRDKNCADVSEIEEAEAAPELAKSEALPNP